MRTRSLSARARRRARYRPTVLSLQASISHRSRDGVPLVFVSPDDARRTPSASERAGLHPLRHTAPAPTIEPRPSAPVFHAAPLLIPITLLLIVPVHDARWPIARARRCARRPGSTCTSVPSARRLGADVIAAVCREPPAVGHTTRARRRASPQTRLLVYNAGIDLRRRACGGRDVRPSGDRGTRTSRRARRSKICDPRARVYAARRGSAPHG